MNRETQLYAREQSVRDKKPVLTSLIADVVSAVEQASTVTRRESLEGIVAMLGECVADPKYQDATPEEADAARAAWEVPKR